MERGDERLSLYGHKSPYNRSTSGLLFVYILQGTDKDIVWYTEIPDIIRYFGIDIIIDVD